MKRAKRHEQHLQRKAAAQEKEGGGLVAKIKDVARVAAETVSGVVSAVVDKVRGREKPG